MWLAETTVSRVHFWHPVQVGHGSDHLESTAWISQSYCLSQLGIRLAMLEPQKEQTSTASKAPDSDERFTKEK